MKIVILQLCNVITLIFETGLGLFFLVKMLTIKKTMQNKFYLFVFFMIHCTLILTQHFSLPGYDKFFLYLFIDTVMFTLFSISFCNGNLVLKLFLTLIYISCITLCIFPTNFLIRILTALIPSFENSFFVNDMLSILLPKLLLFGIVFLFLRSRINTQEQYPYSYYFVMIIAPVLNISSIIILKPYYDFPFVFIIGILTFLIELFIYYMIWQSTTVYAQRIQLELINQQQIFHNQHMKDLKNIVSEYHQLRHDIRNHFVCMDRMLSQSKYEQLKKYFYKYNHDFYALDNQIETGNEIVNQIINLKYADTSNHHIPMKVDIVLGNELGIPDYKICSLLCNLLDNAIEASKKISDPEIEIRIKIIESYLSITVINKIDASLSSSAHNKKSTKAKPHLHGLGLQIVNNIVQTYNGISLFEVDDLKYTASIMLEMPESLCHE